jgi:hypothetical protein
MTEKNDKRKIIGHLAKHYSASELAECLLICQMEPYANFWMHLDAIRIARLPAKIRKTTTLLASLERSRKRSSINIKTYSRLTHRIIKLQVNLQILNNELARANKKQQQETAA